MGSSSAPPAPDYKGAAQATAAGNQNAAIEAQKGNMVNQNAPTAYKVDAQGNYVLGADGQKVALGSGGVSYTSDQMNPDGTPEVDSHGNLPFDMTGLTTTQKAQYEATGKLPKGFVPARLAPTYTQTQNLNEIDQAIFDKNLATNNALSDVALQGVGTVQDLLKKGVDARDLNYGTAGTAGKMTTDVGIPILTGGGINLGKASGDIAGAGSIATGVNPYGEIQNSIADAGNILTQTGANAQALTSVDNNANLIRTDAGAKERAAGLANNNADQIKTNLGVDPQLLNQQTQDALYKANTQYLDPQFRQSQSKLESQLANQGITRGSQAYNDAMLNFNNQKQQAYESARNSAISGSTQAAQGMFGMGLQGAQFGNSALGQQFGQNVTAQQLANSAAGQNNTNAQANQQLYNSALGQQFGQNLQAGQFTNAGMLQNNTNAMNNAAFTNSAQAQQFGQNATSMEKANAAQAQGFGQNLSNATFGNEAQAQQFGQNQAETNAGNAALTQNFAMEKSNQDAKNAALKDTFNAGVTNANLKNETLAQQFNQGTTNATLQNSAVAQDFAQQQAEAQYKINMLNAVRTGSQLQTANVPTVGVSTPGQLANWQGADMLGAATAQGQYDQGIYNADQALKGQIISAGIQAGGAVAGAAVKSDIRLKKNIVKLGIHKTLGIGLYTWDYLWGEKGAGVMAQELEKVLPEAVFVDDDGFKAVKYSMLGVAP